MGAQLSRGMYRVTGRVAAGGFGITYGARDNLDRKVATRECFPAGASAWFAALAAQQVAERAAARAEIDLMLVGTTVPNPGPAQTPAAACPSWTTPGDGLRFTGAEIYNTPRMVATQAGGTADLTTCDGLPAPQIWSFRPG